MQYIRKDLTVLQKYSKLFRIIYKGEVITSNVEKTFFRVIYTDFATNVRKLKVEKENEFIYDSDLCIYWTLEKIGQTLVFVYWSWPEDEGCAE